MSVAPYTSGSCASFGWLWLTDLHQGQHSQDWLWPELREEFFADVARLHRQCGPWDFVLFTGDLVFSGLVEEFDGLTSMLEKLWGIFKILQKEPPYFLPVPGNHDLTRPDKTSAAASALRHYWDDETVRQAFWKNSGSDYRHLITTAFKAYTDWSDRLSLPRPPDYQHGLLPGDFSTTIRKGDAQIGIVGLNTTFLQLEGGDYQGRLELEPLQLHNACGGDAASWLRQRHACFLLTHQPPNWLHPLAVERFRGVIYRPQSFAAHFHGHMHERADLAITEGGALPRRFFQGCSLFGLEHYGEAFDKERFKFGYAAGRLELHHDRAYLYLWPRVARKQQAGDWRLVRDVEAGLLDEEAHLPPYDIPLTIPCKGPGGIRPGGTLEASATSATATSRASEKGETPPEKPVPLSIDDLVLEALRDLQKAEVNTLISLRGEHTDALPSFIERQSLHAKLMARRPPPSEHEVGAAVDRLVWQGRIIRERETPSRLWTALPQDETDALLDFLLSRPILVTKEHGNTTNFSEYTAIVRGIELSQVRLQLARRHRVPQEILDKHLLPQLADRLEDGSHFTKYMSYTSVLYVARHWRPDPKFWSQQWHSMNGQIVFDQAFRHTRSRSSRLRELQDEIIYGTDGEFDNQWVLARLDEDLSKKLGGRSQELHETVESALQRLAQRALAPTPSTHSPVELIAWDDLVQEVKTGSGETLEQDQISWGIHELTASAHSVILDNGRLWPIHLTSPLNEEVGRITALLTKEVTPDSERVKTSHPFGERVETWMTLFDLGFSLETLRIGTSPTHVTDDECVLHGYDVTELFRRLVKIYAMPNKVVAKMLSNLLFYSRWPHRWDTTPPPSDARLLIEDDWPSKPELWLQGLRRAQEIMVELGPTATTATCQVRAPELGDALQVALGTDTFDAVDWQWIIDNLQARFKLIQH